MITNIILLILVVVISITSLITTYKLKNNFLYCYKKIDKLIKLSNYLCDIKDLYSRSYFDLLSKISVHSNSTNAEIANEFSAKVSEERFKIENKYYNDDNCKKEEEK